MRSNRRAVLQIGLSELLGLVLSIILVILIVLLAARLVSTLFGGELEEAGSREAFVSIAKTINDLYLSGQKFEAKKIPIRLHDEHLIVLFDSEGTSKVDTCDAWGGTSWISGCKADEEVFERPLNCQGKPCVCLYKHASGVDTTCKENFKVVECIRTSGMHRAYTLDYRAVEAKASGPEAGILEAAYKNMLGKQVPVPAEYPRDAFPYPGQPLQFSHPFIYGECDGWGSDVAFGTRTVYIERLELPVNGVRTSHYLITLATSALAGREALFTQRYRLTQADLKEAYEKKQYPVVIARADEMAKVPNQKPETLAEISYWYTRAQLATFRERGYITGYSGVYGAVHGYLGNYPSHAFAPDVLEEALNVTPAVINIYNKDFQHDALQYYAKRIAGYVANINLSEQQRLRSVKHFADLFRDAAASPDPNFWHFWSAVFSDAPIADMQEILKAGIDSLAVFAAKFPASSKLFEARVLLRDALLTTLATKPSGRTSLVDIIDGPTREEDKAKARQLIAAICASDLSSFGADEAKRVQDRCGELKAAGRYGVR
jgi:hypothetical protein